MVVSGAGKAIQTEVTSWEGVSFAPHPFGGVEFTLGSREIGHVHGDSLVDVPFPRRVRDELVSAGQAEPHHVLRDSGWVSVRLNDPADVDRAIAVLRRSFALAVEQRERRAAHEPSVNSRGQ